MDFNDIEGTLRKALSVPHLLEELDRVAAVGNLTHTVTVLGVSWLDILFLTALRLSMINK